MTTEPIGINLWTKSSRTRGKRTKLEIITEISSITHTKVLDIGTLSVSDLTKILKKAKEHEVLKSKPIKGKGKKPYIEQLQPFFPEVKNLEKLSVASLSSLLEAFNHDY